MAVPGLERNCHDIEVMGEFGGIHLHIENIPTENLRTGRQTVMSIIRTLQSLASPLQKRTENPSRSEEQVWIGLLPPLTAENWDGSDLPSVCPFHLNGDPFRNCFS